MLELVTDEGAVDITAAADLPTITEAELQRWGITGAELYACFEEGQRLMRSYTAAARARPCAEQRCDGRWQVTLVRYATQTDPTFIDLSEWRRSRLH